MKRYQKKTILLLTLTLLTCIVFAFLFVSGFYISALVMLAAIVGEGWMIYRHLENNTRTMMQFIWSVRYTDFLTSYIKGGKTEENISPELAEAMGEAVEEYKKQLQQKESQLQYFKALANHIDMSVLVFESKSGKIEWINMAAQIQTGLKQAETIDDLQVFHPDLPTRLRTLVPGDISLLQVQKGKETYQLALSGMSFVILGKQLTVVSMKNIRSVLEDKETEAWQKLIRVLTHEIMNSMTPIVSLTELLQKRLESGDPLLAGERDDINRAFDTIRRRSNGLLYFVENYRKVTGIPTPVMQVVSVKVLLQDMEQLHRNSVPGFSVEYPPVHIQIVIDKGQIEQALINLIKNAQEALEEKSDPFIRLSAGIDRNGYPFISVEDNGPGIAPAVAERIFIPFFTTKPSGSGIGLSISRQIMHLHRGSLTVSSEEDNGSRFTLTFRPVSPA